MDYQAKLEALGCIDRRHGKMAKPPREPILTGDGKTLGAGSLALRRDGDLLDHAISVGLIGKPQPFRRKAQPTFLARD